MNIGKLMQQAQKAQAEMQRALGELEVEGSAGGGLVKVRVNGLKDLKAVHLDLGALAQEDPSLINDLVLAAWDEATRQIEQRSAELLRGLGLPPGFPGLG